MPQSSMVNEMKINIYTDGLPEAAREIREKVFMQEQGFQDEFDSVDAEAAHIVIYRNEKKPAATCRVFWDNERQSYVIGRLAVCREYRGMNLGAAAVEEAEHYICEKGGLCVLLHAQCRVRVFYEKLGFVACEEPDEEEGCPHIWMKKELQRPADKM